MSDLVLGAIIGVCATALGAIITGVINHITTKLQINSSREEMSLRQRHEEEQARAERLIKAREGVLIPLRQVISQWMQVTDEYRGVILGLFDRLDGDLKSDDLNKLVSELSDSDRKIMAESRKVASDLKVLQGQIGDSKLDQLILTAKRAQESKTPKAMTIHQLLANPKSSEDPDKDPFKHELDEYASILKGLHGHLLNINKRIEELLSGEPSD